MRVSPLRAYRRAMASQMGNLAPLPPSYSPIVQSDEFANIPVRIEAEKFDHAMPIKRQERISNLIANSQDRSAAEIVRCRVTAFSRRFTSADDFNPVKLVDQNLDRIFLAISAETFTGVTAQLMWYSFGPPVVSGPAAFPNVTGIQIGAGNRDVYNSSVVPIDDIWVTFHNTVGGATGYVTIYEGVSIGNIIS